MTMGHNFDPIFYKKSDLNPPTKMWHKVSRSPLFNHKPSKFIKLAKIALVQVRGSIENECTFSIVAFMKTKLWNRLSTHLDLCTKFHNQHFFMLHFFLMTKQLLNGRSNAAIMHMCSYKVPKP
jgi:hypothetical protein